MSFSTDQFKAAKAFAHTMIVVDDEPLSSVTEDRPTSDVLTPTRKSKTRTKSRDGALAEATKSHPLNAKGLVKTALEVGLVCSVVNPEGSEDKIATNLAEVAKRADIVSLDWHMNKGDDGELATEIVDTILLSDGLVGGRLRLIAIYTGNPDKGDIFAKLACRLNAKLDLAHQVEEVDGALVNSSGLRIVWREKALGAAATKTKIPETDLPKALLDEFSKLSEGLLTNVALGTISAIRDSTHHVLSKFNGSVDGPFFHHRAFLEEPGNSVDYAISVVLSSLKSEVSSSSVASEYLTHAAINRRIRSLEQSPDSHVLKIPNKGAEKSFKLHSREVSRMVTHGFKSLTSAEERKKLSMAVHKRMEGMPGEKVARKHFSSLFFADSASAKDAMLEFSLLTNSKDHELNTRRNGAKLRLDLGSVLFSPDNEYLLCLQATCDTVRGKGAFFFVPLIVADENHDHVVPHSEAPGVRNLVCLSLPPGNSYTRSVILNFGEIDTRFGGVPLKFERLKKRYFVKDTNGNKYRWLANLKYKRALRTAQKVSQDITRIGFDEFEPFRK